MFHSKTPTETNRIDRNPSHARRWAWQGPLAVLLGAILLAPMAARADQVLYSEDFEASNPEARWTLTGDWRVRTSSGCLGSDQGFNSPFNALVFDYGSSCSYANNRSGFATLVQPITLPLSKPDVSLRWYDFIGAELGSDFYFIQVSTDNGATWPYEIYRDSVDEKFWDQESVDLSQFVGQTIRIRFGFTSDSTITGPGWYIDDLQVVAEDLPAGVSAVAVTGASVVEGNAGETDLNFTIEVSPVNASPITLERATVNGTAISGLDYVGSSGLVTIPANTSSYTLAVKVRGDAFTEGDETFSLVLTNPSANAVIASGTAIGTIIDDEALTCSYTEDFEPKVGTFRWNTGYASDQSESTEPAVIGLWHVEDNDTCIPGLPGYASASHSMAFKNLGACGYDDPSGWNAADPGNPFVYTRMINSEPIPGTGALTAQLSFKHYLEIAYNAVQDAVTTASVQVSTGGAGGPWITLREFKPSAPSEQNFVIPWQEEVISLNEYVGQAVMLRFVFFQPVEVDRNTANGWFIDDFKICYGPRPTGVSKVRIANKVETEGNAATKVLSFPVTIEPANSAAITLSCDTAALSGIGAATPGVDYQVTPVQPLKTIPAGTTSTTLDVLIIGDDEPNEGNESFNLKVTPVSSNVFLVNQTATGTIQDDDVPSTFDVTVSGITTAPPEVPEGIGTAQVVVTIDTPRTVPITLQYETIDDTAVSGTGLDFQKATGSITFPANTTSQTFPITIFDDSVYEDPDTGTLPQENERFFIKLSSLSPYADTGALREIQLVDNDPDDPAISKLSIAATAVAEGSCPETSSEEQCATLNQAKFRVTLNQPQATATITMAYTTENGTATAGDDFVASSGTVTFPPGSTTQDIFIDIWADRLEEIQETFRLVLTTPTGPVNPVVTTSTCTISDDDFSGVAFGANGDRVIVRALDSTTSAPYIDDPSTGGPFDLTDAEFRGYDFGTLYGWEANDLVTINLFTNAATRTAASGATIGVGSELSALAWDHTNGIAIAASTDGQLFTLDLDTATLTAVATSPASTPIFALAVHPTTGRIYAVLRDGADGGALYSISRGDWTFTLIGVLSAVDGGGAASQTKWSADFDDATGSLYLNVLRASGWVTKLVNLATASTTSQLDAPAVSSIAIASAPTPEATQWTGDLSATDREPSGIDFDGDTGLAGTENGRVVASIGDVNSDTFDDYLITASTAAVGDLTDAGQAFVLFGGPNGAASEWITNYLNSQVSFAGLLDGANGVLIQGSIAAQRLGVSGAGLGDVNGDKIADFALGYRGANSAGGVYLIFGSRTLPATINSNKIGTGGAGGVPGVWIKGVDDNDLAGASVSGAGDMNSDGYQDIIIGAPGAAASSPSDNGAAYVVFGSPTGIGTAGQLALQSIKDYRGLIVTGELPGDHFGTSVSGAGDLNGDGIDDIVITAPNAAAGAGVAYVIYGHVDFNTSDGRVQDIQLARLLLPSPTGANDPYNLVFYPTVPPLGQLGTYINPGTPGAGRPGFLPGIRITGQAGSGFGAVAKGVGDVNGDALADLLLTAPTFDGSALTPAHWGEIYLLLGAGSIAPNINASDIGDTVVGALITGVDDGDLTGASAAGAGDVNGDGLMDIIIGARDGESGGFDGEAYIVYGSDSLSGTLSLRDLASGSKGTYLFNTQGGAGYNFGMSVSGAGDFDDDGISDLIVGRDNGAYVFLGRSSQDQAVYQNRMRSGANLKTNEDIKQGDYVSGRVGMLGDGSLSRPASRLALQFRGGGTGNNITSASKQTITLFRKPSPDVIVGSNTPEDDARWVPGGVYWKVDTDREKFTESKMTFYYRPEEIEGFDLQRVRIYYAKPDAVLNANTVWSLLPVEYDPDRGAISVKRFHDADTAQSSFNGYYALVQADFIVTLGNEIPPVGLTSEQVSQDGPLVTVIEGTTLTFWHQKEKRLYATGEGKLTVTWRDISNSTTNSVDVITRWPTDDFGLFQTYIANTPPVSLAEAGPVTMKAWQLMSKDSTLTTATGTSSSPTAEVAAGRFRAGLTPTTSMPTARALVMMSDAELFAQGNIYFQFVRTYPIDNASILVPQRDFPIGAAVTAATDPSYQQFHDEATGAPLVFDTFAPYARASARYPGYYDAATRTGSIVWVNKVAGSTKPRLVFYQRGQKLINALTGGLLVAPGTQNAEKTFAWPHRSAAYNPVWPAVTATNTITVSRQNGSEEIPAATYGTEIDVYVQNNSGLPGFNPNEEHALIAPYGSGKAVFALRNDLNSSATSDPWVLMTYKDPNDLDINGEPRAKMKPFNVVLSTSQYPFSNWPGISGINDPYEGNAGQLVLPPYPLSTLRQSADNQVNAEAYKDRNNSIWAISAGSVELTLFYPALPDFYFPPAYQTRYAGTRNFTDTSSTINDVPWLDGGLTPVSPQGKVVYTTVWPAEAPVMKLGEVLIEARQGLPQINGQCSVTVEYESNAAGTAKVAKNSIVKMIDPVAGRGVSLEKIPLDVETALSGGDITFPGLPPALNYRIKYDQGAKQLVCYGRVVDPVAGFDYPLLNVLTTKDRDLLQGLSSDGDWDNACGNLYNAAKDVIYISEANVSTAEVLALSSGDAVNTGYVTLVFQNADSCSPLPVSVEIIKVVADINPGSIAVVKPACVFEEKLTLLHTNDFGGAPNNFSFEWKTLPDEDGTIPDLPDGTPSDHWVVPDLGAGNPNGGDGVNEITIKGPGLLTLTDNWFTVRYKRKSGAAPWGSNYSDWAPPQLAPGWIKRVVGQINPFNQRAGGGGIAGAEAQFAAFSEDAPNVIGNMISLAGPRFTGSVPLNCENLDGFGLIPIYSTVLNRGATLSIDALSPINNPGVNNALILAASRINDLYMVLGNEAYADAEDPTIAFGTDDGEYGAQSTSIHAFMNQTSSLLEEELSLLRGRDDTYAPGTHLFPFYNKLVWNFTKDFTGGEVAYALNYNLADAVVGGDGVISEQDAKDAFPQGHGDAWGHYLTAIKTYYRLLRHPYFAWTNRSEAYLVGGQPVTVDYLDERKFAKSAAAKARTGAEIVNLEYRDGYIEDPAGQWQALTDTDPERAWGFTQWAERAGQGSFIDWAVGNAILPAVDPNPDHTGVTKIDRTTVAELVDVSNAYNEIQSQVDSADLGLNPLGLGTNVIPFDINPGDIDDGLTHFEQIYGRAVSAINNAVTAFDNANNSTQLLRRQADTQLAFERDVQDQELDFKARLIELYGTPYSDDIGPGGTYPRDYDGPDLFHYMYTEESPLLRDGEIRQTYFTASTGGDNHVDLTTTSGTSVVISNASGTEIRVGVGGISLPITVRNYGSYDYNTDGSANTQPTKGTVPVKFNLGLDSQGRIGVRKPTTWTGTRRATGQLQTAQSEVIQNLGALVIALREYQNFLDDIDSDIELINQRFAVNAAKLKLKTDRFDDKKDLLDAIQALRITAIAVNRVAAIIEKIAAAAAETVPTVTGIIVGFSNGVIIDGLAPVRGTFETVAAVLVEIAAAIADGAEIGALALELTDQKADLDLELDIDAADFNFDQYSALKELEKNIGGELPLRVAMYNQYEATLQAVQNYRTTLVNAEQTVEQLDIFRKRTSADVQGLRYKDMAFRIFRNEQLQKYRAQYDLAARYTYLAAKAYDYETTMLSTDSRAGERFLTDIVRARQLGTITDGEPQPGQGLANSLALMSRNFGVLSGQLGFNNPQVETNRFSLRYELFRQLTGPDGDDSWRALLDQDYFTAGVGKVDNVWDVPEFVQYCVPPAGFGDTEPALVIPFSTTITEGRNFFDKEIGGFDNAYDSTQFATKIRSVGIWFSNYDFFNLSNTPRVYLVPVGTDILRSPTGAAGTKRYFKVLDQLLPVPYPIGNADLDSPNWIPSVDGLDGQLQAIRRFGRLRAYHDSGEFSEDEVNSDSRLIGRSVWNTKWMLIIPGSTFSSDAEDGLDTFINGVDDGTGVRDGNGVKDIKIFFETYAYPRVKSAGAPKDAGAAEVTVLAEPDTAN